jgi:RNA polymerase sigma-70 factor (ECF subfamily)
MTSQPGRPIDPGPVQPASQDPPRLTPLAELQLLEAHRGGDPAALGRLLEAYQRRIHSICYRMIRNEHEARDLTQDAMLRVIQGLDSYDGRSKLSTWVIRVTMNTCLSHLRKQKLRRHASLDAASESAASGPMDPRSIGELSPPGRVQQAEMRLLLGRALLCIDPDMRAVLVLRDMQELNYERIAKALEVPIGTVKSRLFRARLALRVAVEVELGRGGVDDAADESIDE